jgi:3-methyladenine DNA glycosylase AlkD
MDFKIKRRLKRLNNKQIAEDIKQYLKSPHEFYEVRIPEMKVLAKRLHEEYSLKDFYKVFNKLWKSGRHEEISLAIYAFQLYQDRFDMDTWKFLKPKLKDMKSWDQIDNVSIHIIGPMLIEYPQLEKEILKLSKVKNFWLKRLAIISTLPSLKKGRYKLTLALASHYLYEKEEHIQKATGWILNEIGKEKPELIKRFILKNMNMPDIMFEYATENMKELRRIRNLKKLEKDDFE